MAVLAVSAVGAFVGSALLPAGLTILGTAVSGAALGWTAGALIGSALFPAKLPTQHGPRLSDLKVQSSAYGAGIPVVYGAMRLAGNVIWSADIRERKKKKKSGGKGGPTQTVVTYTYSCSFAVGLCEGPIAGVRRIWADGVLIYDLGASASAETIAASTQAVAGIRIYTGSTSQLPDPTMEAHLGVGNVPGHRGLAYIVFADLQLAKFGNRVPNITVELLTAGSTAGYRRLSATDLGLGLTDVVGLGWRDGVLRFAEPGVAATHNIAPNGAYLGTAPHDGFLPSRSGRFVGSNYREQLVIATTPVGDLTIDEAAAGDEIGTSTYTLIDVGGHALDDLFPASRWFLGLALTPESDATAIFVLAKNTSGNSVATHWYLLTYSGLGYAITRQGTVSGSLGGIGTSTICSTAQGGGLDDHDVAVLEADRYVWIARGAGNGDLACWEIGDDDVLRQIGSLIGGNGLPSYNFAAPSLAADGGICIAYCDSHSAVFTRVSSLTATAPTVGDIVAALCARAGLQPGEYDTDDLTDSITGYALAQPTSARAAIEPLAAAFGFDPVESGDVLRFVPRGGAAVATLDADDLAAHADGESHPPVLVTTRAEEGDLPRTVRVHYLDPGADYQPGVQEARRLQTSSRVETSVELAIAMSAAQARAAACAILYRAWQGRQSYRLSVARDHTALEPTDPITAMGLRMRLTSVARGANGVIQIEAEAEDTGTIYGLTLPADGGTHAPQSVGLPGPTALAVLDLPALRDQDDDGGVYLAARGYLSGWEGAVVYRSADAGETWAEIDTLLDAATLGTATTALADGTTTVWDYAHTVTVQLLGGELESASEAAVLNGANAAALGGHGRWEIIQWQTATLVDTNTYTLSGLLRGRRGTEWATGLHQIGDAFVLLDSADLLRVLLSSADYGAVRRWRGASVGLDTLSGDSVDIAAAPESLMPYAPVLTATRYNATPYTYAFWRLTLTAVATPVVSFAEWELRGVAGGPSLLTGATATASSFYDPTRVPSKAIDGDLTTEWAAGENAMPQWLQCQTPAPIGPVEMMIMARDEAVYNSPTAWTLSCSSNGTTWTVIDTRTGQTGWTLSEIRTYALPLRSDVRLDWFRRARTNAEWRDGADVPLDEAVEQYRLRMLDVDTGAPLDGFEWIVTGSTTYSITPDTIAAAYGSSLATVRVDVAQIGSIGAGHTAEVIA